MYGLQRRVTSIDFALLILGFSELKNIISVLSLTEAFKNKTDKYLDQKEFWLHSLLTGCAAKRLAEDLEFYNSGEAFIGGFLHDMGVSVIHKYFHTNFIQIQDLVVNNGLTYIEAELETLGMNHQEIGKFLIHRWNFPLELCNAIFHHHKPSEAKQEDKMLASIIHFADYMTHKLSLGEFSYDKGLEVDKEALSIMQFKDDIEMDRFIEGYRELFINQIEAVRYLN
jgi:HD-like signal output (HDOD) protein